MFQVSITLIFVCTMNQNFLLTNSQVRSGRIQKFVPPLRRDQTEFDTFSRKSDSKWIRVPSGMIESHERELKMSPEEGRISSSLTSSKEEPLTQSASEQEDLVAPNHEMTGEEKSEDVIQEMDDHDHFTDLKSLPSDETGEIINSEESRVDDPRTGTQDMLADSTHHGGGGHGGWLDMGAYSGKKGAFGWYADFPVGYG